MSSKSFYLPIPTGIELDGMDPQKCSCGSTDAEGNCGKCDNTGVTVKCQGFSWCGERASPMAPGFACSICQREQNNPRSEHLRDDPDSPTHPDEFDWRP